MALLTLDDVLNWVPQGAADEGLVTDAITLAQGLADRYCLRTLESAAHDEYIDVALGETQLHVSSPPITAVSQIDEEAQADTPTTLDSDEYYYDSESGIITRDGGTWSAGIGAVRVQYTGGYTTSTLPAGLKFALQQLVGWVLEARGNVGVTSEGIDGYSVTYGELRDGVPERVAALLDPFVRRVVG